MYLPDVPISVAFGGLIVASNLYGRRSVEQDAETLRRRTWWQTAVFGLLFHCPDSFFAFVWYPDWNLGYLASFDNVGYLGALGLCASLFGFLLLGRYLALKVSRRDRRLVWIPVLAGVAVFAVTLAAIWDRYQHVGTYSAYHEGTAVQATSDPTFLMFTTLAGMYLLVPLIVLLSSNLVRSCRRG